MNNAFRTRLLAGSEVISKYHSPLSSWKDKISSQELYFQPVFWYINRTKLA